MAWATHPKWRRWLGGPYRCTPIEVDALYDLWKWDPYTDRSIDVRTCTDWDDFFNFYAAGQNWSTRKGYGTSDDTGHLLDPSKWPAGDSLMLPYCDTSPSAYAGGGKIGNNAGYPSFLMHARGAGDRSQARRDGRASGLRLGAGEDCAGVCKVAGR